MMGATELEDPKTYLSSDDYTVFRSEISPTLNGEVSAYESADNELDGYEYVDVYSKEQINSLVEISEVPGKGNCMFVRREYKPGSLILIEAPLFVVVPSTNQGIWDILCLLHEQSALSLPPLWHQAALVSIIYGSEEKKSILKTKWVLNRNPVVSEDVYRVLQAICHLNKSGDYIYNDSIVIDPKLYQYFLQVWPLNAFGHSTDPDGLIIYDKISFTAHSCDASCCWHHSGDDHFILRARRHLVPGDEITISYLGESDLLIPTYRRRELLENWSFHCACERCNVPMDVARGFLCKICHFGSVFLFQDSVFDSLVSAPCSLCNYKFTESEVQEYLDLEKAYTHRVDSIDTSDIHDILQVYNHARNVFKQHWILYQLQTLLFDAYKEKGDLQEAKLYLLDRICYADKVMARPLYCIAFMYEELGDILVSTAEIDIENCQIKNSRADTGTLNMIMNAYLRAAALLAILCGCNHSYYCAVVVKRSKIEEIAVTVMRRISAEGHQKPSSAG